MDKTLVCKPRAARAEVAIGANSRTDTGQRAFAAMIDLTAAGCCLFSRDATFAIGQKVSLHPECLAPITGTIQWSRGSLAGMRFDNELYSAVFEHLARTYPWQLSMPAKLALEPEAPVPPVVKCELERMLGRADKIFRERAVPLDVLTRRPPTLLTGRPGTGAQETNRKLTRLFHA